MRIRVGDIEVGYDRAGAGEPVLLVMGLSATRIGWINQMPVLAERYDVVAFDNRGVGETDAPAEAWTLERMADDAIALLDALEIGELSHVVGISMGGMISQEIVLRHPDRVRSLTLISTHHGGPEVAQPSEEVIASLMPVPGADPVERARAGVLYAFGRRYREEHPEVVEMAIEYLAANPPPEHGVMNQVMAIMGWSGAGGAARRLSSIDVPTLVLHGDADELVPVDNARLLADTIPGALLTIFPGAGHALIQERADEVNAELLGHIASASAHVG